MRQFLLGKDVAYPTTALSNDSVVDGAIGFYFRKSDKTIFPTATGTEITKDCMLIVNRSVDKGGHVVIPIHKNKFSYVKGVYQAGKVNKTADELAEALAKAINNNSVGSKVVATASGATLTIDGQVVGMDYEVVPADLLTGLAATSTQKGEAAYGDAQYIIDLANKAAADAGFEYTYQEAGELMRPHYPLNPLEVSDAADKGFTIFTLSFAEPRDVKTRDEVINQIVQVAFPTGAEQITTFETVCKALAG